MSAFPQWMGADGVNHRYYMKTNPNTVFDSTSQMGHGCVAVKKELVFNGFSVTGFDPDSSLIGLQADQTIRLFQSSIHIEADGVAGPITCRKLFDKRCLVVETKYSIPNRYITRQSQLESGWDPAARGVIDPRDRGLMQINSYAHPDVSDEQADDPSFSLDWAARGERAVFNAYGDWDCALASYNVGTYYAYKWLIAGKPATGLYNDVGKDMAQICTNYVKLIKSQVI